MKSGFYRISSLQKIHQVNSIMMSSLQSLLLVEGSFLYRTGKFRYQDVPYPPSSPAVFPNKLQVAIRMGNTNVLLAATICRYQICRIVGPSHSFTSLSLCVLSSHKYNMEFSVCKMLSFDLCPKWLQEQRHFFVWALFKQLFYTLFYLIIFFLQLHTSMLIMEI